MTAAPTPLATRNVPDIIAELKRIIVEDLDVRIAAADVTPEVPLLEGGLALDSIVLYELITLIEKRFGFEIADDQLDTALFANLTVLAGHISRQAP
ncbi:MAG TPA: phosphopantetheine-binding protein [Kofleriaceae bacterium]|nr:phosphopantetheine-binding protein [Kofleriaceae bacterium]